MANLTKTALFLLLLTSIASGSVSDGLGQSKSSSKGPQISNSAISNLKLNLTFKAINSPSTQLNDISAPQYGLIYKASLAGQELPVLIDLNTKLTIVGEKGAQKSSWGIQCQAPDCMDSGTAIPAGSIIYSTSLTGNDGKLTIELPKGQNRLLENVFLLTNGDPVHQNGILGLGPDSSVLKILQTANSNAKLSYSIKSTGNLTKDMQGLSKTGLEAELVLGAPETPQTINKATQILVNNVYSSYSLTGGQASFQFTQTKAKSSTPINKPKTGNTVTLLTKDQTVCILPGNQLGLQFSISGGGIPDQLGQFLSSVAATVCPKATDVSSLSKSVCGDIRNGPVLSLNIGGQDLDLGPQDYIYFQENGNLASLVTVSGSSSNFGIFSDGGPCKGASLALGGLFFAKYKLLFGVDSQSGSGSNLGWYVGFVAIEEGSDLFWILLIAFFVIALVVVVVVLIIANRRSGDQDQSLTVDHNDDSSAYKFSG